MNPPHRTTAAALPRYSNGEVLADSERLAEDVSAEALAGLVELSPFHFSRVFKQATGMSPLQFVWRERITRAQQLIRANGVSRRRKEG